MILIDYNQTVIASYSTSKQSKHSQFMPDYTTEELVRHKVLNTIRSVNTKYRAKYGKIVIACDSKRSWRKDVFPYYKAARKKARSQSDMNWTELFEVLDKLKDELRNYFPYKVVEVERAEADDVIAVLTKLYSPHEPVMIISGDKDFVQLHGPNVQQADLVRKRMISHPNPREFLYRHIISGDRGDGIPNILSPASSFVDEERQRRMMTATLTKWVDRLLETEQVSESEDTMKEFVEEMVIDRWKENAMLIDLDKIPSDVVQAILDEHNSPDQVTDRSKLMTYMIKHRLKKLSESISDF